jgi:hypothetical protein
MLNSCTSLFEVQQTCCRPNWTSSCYVTAVRDTAVSTVNCELLRSLFAQGDANLQNRSTLIPIYLCPVNPRVKTAYQKTSPLNSTAGEVATVQAGDEQYFYKFILTFYSQVITMCTTCCNITSLCSFPTRRTLVFRRIIIINSHYFPQ